MSYIVLDAEANGLLYDATKMHCLCWEDSEGTPFKAIGDEQYAEAIQHFNEAGTVVGHNIMGYDLPLFEKLGYECTFKCIDTMIMSSLVDPDRPKGHSLESYAPDEKVANEDWSELTPNMLARCESDVSITHKLYKKFTKIMEKWDWAEAMELEHKIAYYHAKQGMNGVKVDKSKARLLYFKIDTEIKQMERYLVERIGYRLTFRDSKELKPFKKDGDLSARALKYYGHSHIVGPSCKITLETINLNSFVQIKDYLLLIGWKPDEWNYKKNHLTGRLLYVNGKPVKGSPKITESSMNRLDSELGKLLARYFILKHRRGFIYKLKKNGKLGGLIPNIRSDGRVEAGGFPLGTNTRRYRHRIVVNVPKADEKVIYGYELRDLFIHEPGMILMGTDADSLEARIAGHYTYEFDNGIYAEQLLNSDVHDDLKDYLLEKFKIKITRQHAKGVFYGISYGAQPSKVADIVGCSKAQGQVIYDAFWEKNHALAQVRDKYVKEWKEKGYITALDGGRLSIRSEHSVMNTLFQSAGSIVVKRATIRMNEGLENEDLTESIKQVIHYHDEYTTELPNNPRMRKAIKRISEEAWDFAGKYYKLNVPITGTAEFGHSWAEVH